MAESVRWLKDNNGNVGLSAAVRSSISALRSWRERRSIVWGLIPLTPLDQKGENDEHGNT